MSSEVTVSPATMPSTTATNARPWDSPAVVHRNTSPIFPRQASTTKKRRTALPRTSRGCELPETQHQHHRGGVGQCPVARCAQTQPAEPCCRGGDRCQQKI